MMLKETWVSTEVLSGLRVSNRSEWPSFENTIKPEGQTYAWHGYTRYEHLDKLLLHQLNHFYWKDALSMNTKIFWLKYIGCDETVQTQPSHTSFLPVSKKTMSYEIPVSACCTIPPKLSNKCPKATRVVSLELLVKIWYAWCKIAIWCLVQCNDICWMGSVCAASHPKEYF